MSPIRFLLLLTLGGAFASPAYADNCGDLATRFAGGERFSLKLGDLDELKTCINVLLREKISASSADARGSTSPSGVADEAAAPRAAKTTAPSLLDAE